MANLLKVSAGQTPAGNVGLILTPCQSHCPDAAFSDTVDLKINLPGAGGAMLRRANSVVGFAAGALQKKSLTI